LVGPMMISRS